MLLVESQDAAIPLLADHDGGGRVLLSFGPSRKMNRNCWRHLHRAGRIIVRETQKATQDMMIFGTGATMPGDLGEWQRDGSDVMRHVPVEEIHQIYQG